MRGKRAAFLAVGGGVCLICAWWSLKGVLASPDQLLARSDKSGTKNPVLARSICWLGFVPLSIAGVGLLAVAGWLVYGGIE